MRGQLSSERIYCSWWYFRVKPFRVFRPISLATDGHAGCRGPQRFSRWFYCASWHIKLFWISPANSANAASHSANQRRDSCLCTTHYPFACTTDRTTHRTSSHSHRSLRPSPPFHWQLSTRWRLLKSKQIFHWQPLKRVLCVCDYTEIFFDFRL